MPLIKLSEFWTKGTHIEFRETGTSPSGKTKIFEVRTLETDFIVLGIIRWMPRWRKYWFEPNPQTGYEETCMQEIADFLKVVTKAHRANKNAAQSS